MIIEASADSESPLTLLYKTLLLLGSSFVDVDPASRFTPTSSSGQSTPVEYVEGPSAEVRVCYHRTQMKCAQGCFQADFTSTPDLVKQAYLAPPQTQEADHLQSSMSPIHHFPLLSNIQILHDKLNEVELMRVVERT